MPTDSHSWIALLWDYAKAHDLPNWFAFAFTVVLWPIALLLWQRRRVNNVPNLEVHFVAGYITIAGIPHDAVDIQVINHTGSVVYLSGARIRNCSNAFSVPADASRDRGQNSHHLSFMDEQGKFIKREVTLQTNEVAKTCIAVTSPMDSAFFAYAAPMYRRLLRSRKYFVLEYTAMVGATRNSVATLY